MKILIVGAGISGATCARILAEQNHKIDIIDKNSFIGGNCYDQLSSDKSCYIHKFGPHIFHTENKEIWNFVNRYSKFNSYTHCVYTLVKDAIYTFPINLNVISQLYNCHIYSKEQADKLIHDIYYHNPQNFEQAAINSVGTKIYQYFIKNYTQKQWNCDPKQLPAEIFNRINIRYNFNNDYFPNQYQGQPINGYTNMITNMLNHKNINIYLNTDFYTFNTSKYDIIIYSGSFKGLAYRSIRFKHYTSTENNTYSVLNTPMDKAITRITNFNILHKVTANTDINIFNYCEEYPVNNNQLNELYPIYNTENLTKYNQEKNKLEAQYKNIYFIGRLGLYKYLDMDKAIEQCFKLCERIKRNNIL